MRLRTSLSGHAGQVKGLSPAWEHAFDDRAAERERPLPPSDRTPSALDAEDAARELPTLPLEDALQLVHLYAERGSPKFEPAARRWLVRYLTEGTPNLRDFANVTASQTILQVSELKRRRI